jgi:ketosteroid isomerase-like protein
MSQENVEIVRRILDGWARGDFSVGADLLTPDFEWHQFPQAVEPGTRRGAEVGEALSKMFDVYDGLRVEAKEFIDAGDKVVVIGRATATAKGSGLRLDNPVALVWTLREGRLARNEVFTDGREALEAAGLSG